MLRTNLPFLSYIEELYRNQTNDRHITLRTFSPGDLLLKQGELPFKLFILKSGIVKCYFYEENAKGFINEFLSDGEITGELETIRGIPCLCNIEAISDVQAFAIDASIFNLLLEKDTNLNKLLLLTLTDRIINTSRKASIQQLYKTEHGLKKVLDLQSQYGVNISKEDLADYLGVTLRSLNRLLKDLK
jgi:CRP-like cAMP-binding protein|eukprot:gene13817-16285_t